MSDKIDIDLSEVEELAKEFLSTSLENWKNAGADASEELKKLLEERSQEAALHTARYFKTGDQEWLDNLEDLALQTEGELAQYALDLDMLAQEQARQAFTKAKQIVIAIAKIGIKFLLKKP